MTNRPQAANLLIPLWLVWLVAVAAALGGLGGFDILDNNEGLYAEIPREMLASGDWRQWVIPHLDGLPYMEKPPLLYWLTAICFSVFGQAEWVARLVPAASALSCVGMLLAFGRAAGHEQAGRLAALMFISGLGVMAMSHVLMFDMLLTAMLTASLMLAWKALHHGRAASLRLAYVFLALAVLAKGLVALVLFGLVVVAWQAGTSKSPLAFLRGLLMWFEPGALLAFLAVAAPWHVVASKTEPVFAWFYFVNEHVLRFLGQREPHDYYSGAWWYYLPRMAIYLFPWSFLILGMMRERTPGNAAGAGLNRFLFLAWLMPLLFFSVSSAKANYYLVAVMPFAAMHLAVKLEEKGWLARRGAMLPGLVMAGLALILMAVLMKRGLSDDRSLSIMGMHQLHFALLFFLVMAVLAVGAAIVAWRSPRVGILAYLAVSMWCGVSLIAALDAMGPYISTRQVAAFIQETLPQRQVFLYRNFEELSSLPFYLKQPLPVVDPRSNDLFWGDRLRPGNAITLSADRFAQQAARDPGGVAVVVMQRQLADFEAALGSGFAKRQRVGETLVFFN
ncbi:ArnT family glycosyltransferase [Noviherbaspirillum galbum]|uniref:Glycosyltransferase family 39 protein n=1 Tax=Noviherbaspirillum galbum TaxID=2709383 RepID=A0A6B3SWS0_9BURK|nr:glycosyltransferase family 39 protein [Noviherbaspirillum galbum]NEX62862.1 glycosyltransferase family 39 protein [Noviherbaspirillum galbum]